MMKVKHSFSGMLAMLAVLLLTGCQVNGHLHSDAGGGRVRHPYGYHRG